MKPQIVRLLFVLSIVIMDWFSCELAMRDIKESLIGLIIAAIIYIALIYGAAFHENP